MASTFTITQSGATTELYLYPDGDSSTSFTAYGETNNYECVDDPYGSQDEDSTYVYTNKYDDYWDRYTITDASTSTSGTVNYIRVTSRSRSSNYVQATTGIYYHFIDAGTAVNFGNNHKPIPVSYIEHSDTWATDPDGNDWTWSTVNENLRIGVQASSPSYAAISLATYLYPNGAAGGGTGFLKYPDSGNDYDKINDESEETYLYCTGGIAPRNDEWVVDDSSGTVAGCTIDYVEVYGKFLQTAENGAYGVTMKLESTSSNTFYPTTQWETYSNRWYKDPNTSLAWTWSTVNEKLDIGFSVPKPDLGGTIVRCCSLYAKVQYTTTSYDPVIRISQLYATVNYTPDDVVATLTTPSNLQVSHSRKVGRTTFSSGAYEVDDYGRSGKTLTLSGQETSTAAASMQTLKDMVHTGTIVTVGGLSDTNLNTDYHIVDFSFSQEGGWVDRYRWNLTLEED